MRALDYCPACQCHNQALKFIEVYYVDVVCKSAGFYKTKHAIVIKMQFMVRNQTKELKIKASKAERKNALGRRRQKLHWKVETRKEHSEQTPSVHCKQTTETEKLKLINRVAEVTSGSVRPQSVRRM